MFKAFNQHVLHLAEVFQWEAHLKLKPENAGYLPARLRF